MSTDEVRNIIWKSLNEAQVVMDKELLEEFQSLRKQGYEYAVVQGPSIDVRNDEMFILNKVGGFIPNVTPAPNNGTIYHIGLIPCR